MQSAYELDCRAHEAPTDTSDFELLIRWHDGQPEAGAQLIERHFDALYRFFRNKVTDGVEDLVQSSFLGCLEGAERFRGDASFRTYLFRIARFQLYEFLRQKRRGRCLDFTVSSLAALGTSPTGAVARNQQCRALGKALRALPVQMQIALELHYREGMTLAEIAEVQGVPLGTVASWIRRARVQLRGLLPDELAR